MSRSESESEMQQSAAYEWAVNANRYIWKAFGLWSAEEEGATRELLGMLRVAMFFAIGTVVCDSPVAVTDNLVYSIPLLITAMKFTMALEKKEVLLSIADMIAEDWTELKTALKRDAMIRQARIGRTINAIGYTLVYIGLPMLSILPGFAIPVLYVKNETDLARLFPLSAFHGHAASRASYFEIIYVGLTMITCCYTNVRNFFRTFVFRIRDQMGNLRARLANTNHGQTSDRFLPAIVQHRVRLARAVDAIGNTFSLLLYFGSYVRIYGMPITTVAVREEQLPVTRLFFLVCLLPNTFTRTSLYCIARQVLTSRSQRMLGGAYERKWASLKSSKAKTFIVIVAKAKKLLQLDRGKIVPRNGANALQRKTHLFLVLYLLALAYNDIVALF